MNRRINNQPIAGRSPAILWIQKGVAVGLAFGMIAQPSGAAEYIWKGDGGTTDSPKSGRWKTGAHWMGGAPLSAATNELVFKVGNNTYISTNNNGGEFFKLNKLLVELNHATNSGAIEGAPLEFVSNGNTTPQIQVDGTAMLTEPFTLTPRQIKTDARLFLDVSSGNKLIIGGTDKGGIIGTGGLRINANGAGTVELTGNTHNTLAASEDATLRLLGGLLLLNKAGGKIAVNGDMFIRAFSNEGGVSASVKWLQDEQVKSSATLRVTASAIPIHPFTFAAAIMELNGRTETIRGLDAHTASNQSVASVDLGSGKLNLLGNYTQQTQHQMRDTDLLGTRDSVLTKAGTNYTWTFNGNGHAYRGSILVEKGTFELAKGSDLGTANAKCKAVTIKKGAKKNIAGKVNCKVTDENFTAGTDPTQLGLTVEQGGRLVPKSQSDEEPPEDPDAPPAPFDAPGIGTALEVLLAPGSIFEIQLDGPEAGYGFGYHSQLHVLDGPVIIDGSYLKLVLSSEPVLAQQYMILKNEGIGSVQGYFAGKPQGSYYTAYYAGNPYIFQVNYFGGDGNDVVLTNVAIPEPATMAMMLVVWAALSRRRRAS